MSANPSPSPSSREWLDGHERWRAAMAAAAVVRPLLTSALRVRITGLEHVPAEGALLVVANHAHNVDPVLLWLAFPRALHFMGKQELFRNPVLARALRGLGGFPVDRGAADRTAIRTAEQRLAAGFAVAMFPEGTRSPSGQLQPAHPGAGLIAVRSRALILPVGICGTHTVPFNGKKSGRSSAGSMAGGVDIRFGEPFLLPDEIVRQPAASARATDAIMSAIASLLPAEQRGVYATEV